MTTEKSKTPYFIPDTAPPTKEGVEALRREFYAGLEQSGLTDIPPSVSPAIMPTDWVGYYWIGEDNRQKFCGTYDTISAGTARRAQKVYTRPAHETARRTLEAARDADLARYRPGADGAQNMARLIAEEGWRKALAALEAI